MENPLGERSAPAQPQVVVIDRTPPSLLLESPTEPQVATKEVSVAGRTEAGVQLQLNGAPVNVDAGGRFEVTITLQPGPNELDLSAADRAGNAIRLQSVVVFERTGN